LLKAPGNVDISTLIKTQLQAIMLGLAYRSFYPLQKTEDNLFGRNIMFYFYLLFVKRDWNEAGFEETKSSEFFKAACNCHITKVMKEREKDVWIFLRIYEYGYLSKNFYA